MGTSVLIVSLIEFNYLSRLLFWGLDNTLVKKQLQWYTFIGNNFGISLFDNRRRH